MDSIKISFYFSDEKEESFFQFMKQKVEVAAVSDGVQVNIVVKTIGELSKGNNQKDCLVVPFCTKNLDSFIGLKKAWEYRKKADDYKTPFLFVIYTKLSLPDFLNPQTIEAPSIKNLLGNPPFGDVNKAVLMAETFIDTDKSELRNFIPLSFDNDFFEKLYKKILKVIEFNTKEIGKLREAYYDTFISYYDYRLQEVTGDPLQIKQVKIEQFTKHVENISKEKNEYIKEFKKNIKETDFIKENRCKDPKTTIYEILEFADYIHCLLNGRPIPQKFGSHSIPLEPFCAPYPFSLQELINAKSDINDKITSQRPVKLVLVDNKIDKLIKKSEENKFEKGELVKLLFDKKYVAASMFNLEALGSLSLSSKNDIPEMKTDEEYNQLREKESFKLGEFKKDNQYARQVYNQVSSANFVLLDFFLNEENTYLAFDFIKDMAEIKKQEGDSSTTWYFITSAVYDSVVKYSQSGLLAEYYESAVVSAGDDPTNKKRQIIFLYKLLTFINARLNSFKGYKDSIMKCSMFNKACGHNNDYCRKPENCLFPVQSLCRKYTAEYNEITEIFPGTKEREFKETVELLESIITQFLWLPEADWPMIQRQIEYLDLMLEREASEEYKNHKFSCRYILKEMIRRSKIY